MVIFKAVWGGRLLAGEVSREGDGGGQDGQYGGPERGYSSTALGSGGLRGWMSLHGILLGR